MKKGRLIIVAGHSNKAKGATFKNPWSDEQKEHDIVARYCTDVYRHLQKEFDNVLLMPFNLTVEEKVEWINENLTKHDVAYEFHLNSFRNDKAHGTEVYYDHTGIRSTIWAKILCWIMSRRLGTKNRGSKKTLYTHDGSNYVVDNTPGITVILFEGVFGSNIEDLKKFIEKGRRAMYYVCRFGLKHIS